MHSFRENTASLIDAFSLTAAGMGTTAVTSAALALSPVFINAVRRKKYYQRDDRSDDEISEHHSFPPKSFQLRTIFIFTEKQETNHSRRCYRHPGRKGEFTPREPQS